MYAGDTALAQRSCATSITVIRVLYAEVKYKPVHKSGEMPEWLNGTVSKTVVGIFPHREFESHSLR